MFGHAVQIAVNAYSKDGTAFVRASSFFILTAQHLPVITAAITVIEGCDMFRRESVAGEMRRYLVQQRCYVVTLMSDTTKHVAGIIM